MSDTLFYYKFYPNYNKINFIIAITLYKLNLNHYLNSRNSSFTFDNRKQISITFQLEINPEESNKQETSIYEAKQQTKQENHKVFTISKHTHFQGI